MRKAFRGMGGATRASNFGRSANYAMTADQDICVLVQIETEAALDRIDEIAAVDGVDGIFIGPADLSTSMGYADNPRHPAVDAAINDAILRIKVCGKAPGILMVDPVRARECVALGALFVSVAVDLLVLRDGLDAAVALFKSGHAPVQGSY
nr:aldolase/citrate lyase family protein [Pseudomonas cichorii]